MSENIYIGVIGGLFSLVNLLFWNRIKRIEKDLEDEKKKSSSIEKITLQGLLNCILS